MAVQTLPEVAPRRVGRARPRVSIMGVTVALLLLGYYSLLFIYPFGRAVWLSFLNWDFLLDPVFVGMRNYRRALEDPYFWEAAKVTVIYTAARVVIGLTIAFLVALGISQLKQGLQRFYIGIFYLPAVIPGIVSVILWRWLFRPNDGPINGLLGSIGLPSQPFYNSSDQAIWVLVTISIWGSFGTAAIIFFAGINDVPGDLLEAAKLDGAGLWRQTWDVILPLLRPVMFFQLVVGIIGAVQAFEVFYLISGPGFSTRNLTLYTYELGFRSLNLGYGATVSIFIFGSLLVCTVVQFRRFMVAQRS